MLHYCIFRAQSQFLSIKETLPDDTIASLYVSMLGQSGFKDLIWPQIKLVKKWSKTIQFIWNVWTNKPKWAQIVGSDLAKQLQC